MEVSSINGKVKNRSEEIMSDYSHNWIPCNVDGCVFKADNWHCKSYYPQHQNCSGIRKHGGTDYRYVPTYSQRRNHEIRILDYIQTGRDNDCGPVADGYKSKKKVGMAGYDSVGRQLKTRCFHHIPKK